MAVYFDCNATTPIDPRVQAEMAMYFEVEYGNAGSRTHNFGTVAKRAVQRAREQVASVVAAKTDEIIFTSGATESNNIAILGLAPFGESKNRKHIVSTHIEHKAVLEPLIALANRGFEITLVPPTPGGWVEPSAIKEAIRPDTLLVSVMHVNNETGVLQPISEIADLLSSSDAYFHVDAAQGFGKDIGALRSNRIDLISISAHKIYGPKGVGALATRRRKYYRTPLTPIMHGGGQEHGLRPGTLAVPLIAGLGLAAELAGKESNDRFKACHLLRERALSALMTLEPLFNGDQDRCLPHVLNISISGINSEAAIVSLKYIVAISNGSACTSHDYLPSHVLKAMGCSEIAVEGALRFSWCHITENPDWEKVLSSIKKLF